MRIRFVGEGPSEYALDSADWQSSSPHLRAGVLGILVQRILESHLGRPVRFSSDGKSLWRGHGGGYSRKVKASILEAARANFDAVVIVMDRDRDEERRKRLEEGRRQALLEVPIQVVVGLAIEVIEAWLIADSSALGKTLGIPPPQGIPDPESIGALPSSPDHPKNILKTLLTRTGQAQSPRTKYCEIAELCDLQIVERRCPQGFGSFASEVERFLGPLF